MDFYPMKEQALIEVQYEETQTVSGIVVSTKKPKNSFFGKIVKLNTENPLLCIDDLVMFSKFGNQPISLDKEYLIVPTSNILGKLQYE